MGSPFSEETMEKLIIVKLAVDSYCSGHSYWKLTYSFRKPCQKKQWEDLSLSNQQWIVIIVKPAVDSYHCQTNSQ